MRSRIYAKMSKEVGRTSEHIANREGRRDSTPGDRLVTFPTLKLRLGGVACGSPNPRLWDLRVLRRLPRFLAFPHGHENRVFGWPRQQRAYNGRLGEHQMAPVGRPGMPGPRKFEGAPVSVVINRDLIVLEWQRRAGDDDEPVEARRAGGRYAIPKFTLVSIRFWRSRLVCFTRDFDRAT
jgi:hypothetical protein